VDPVSRLPLPARLAFGAVSLLLLAFAVQVSFHVIAAPAGATFEKFATNTVFLGSAGLCLWRAIARPRERRAWLLCTAGLAAWGIGDLYFAVYLWDSPDAPIPSPADIGYLAFYPLVFAGLVVLSRGQFSGRGRSLSVDGLIAGLAAGALAATLLAGPISASTGGSIASVVTNLAYPIADLLVVAVLAGALVVTGSRLRSTWAWMALGLAIFAVTDTLYLYYTAKGIYLTGKPFDFGWPLGALCIAYASWLPTPTVLARERRSIALPLALGLACLTLLVVDRFVAVDLLPVCLAAAGMLAVLVRLWLSFADNARMLTNSRREALTDALTGLGNRRALMADLGELLADDSDARLHVLALYDLDGFKLYNDTFGHTAGDALLARLGANLSDVLAAGGRAYRMGGDEFCILCKAAGGDVRAVVQDGAGALADRGEGFAVSCSYGSILLPEEARSPEAALRLVDQRMYRDKQQGRASVGRQSGDVLRQALSERDPELDAHLSEVASLADSLARRLGLPDSEVDEVRLAAELHDVGKVAIPDAILEKPSPLDDTEWTFMRRHTLIGERIVGAAPSLARVARVVRSTHERVDGGGYPDGLHDGAIPLASRIIFVCDSFHAMTSSRPYAERCSEQDALEELRHCAGSQFDTAIVASFCAMVAERPPRRGSQISRRGSAAPPPASPSPARSR
jgi:two-component system, cell cycle response regulator